MPNKIAVTVIGLGYIGLPTAALIASRGIKVIGVDLNNKVIKTVNDGRVHIKEPALAGLVKHSVDKGFLKAKSKPEEADVFLVTVPTPILEDKTPDLSYVESSIQAILSKIKPGNLVIIESTCPVGTTVSYYNKIIQERPELEGQFYMAYCPERVLPGNIIYELEYNARIIGGINAPSTEMALNFYGLFVKGELIATDSKAAEMCKLTENAYRDVNIAFANEVSMICEKANIDAYELIGLANRHPRVNILKPGPGVGGHCIAIDPWFLITQFDDLASVIRISRETNLKKTDWVLQSIEKEIKQFEKKEGGEPSIGCLGLAYKANVDDLRESPALDIFNRLKQKYSNVLACDPNIESHESIELTDKDVLVEKSDIIILLVPHKEFKKLEIPPRNKFLKFSNF